MLHEISRLSYRIKPKRALATSEEAYSISALLQDREEIAKSLLCIGSSNHILSEYKGALRNFTDAFTIFDELGNRAGKGDALHKLAGLDVELGIYGHSLELCREALQIFSESGDEKKTADTLTVMYSAYERMGDFSNALECCYLSHRFSEHVTNLTRIGLAIINKGNIYSLIGDCDRALTYYHNGLEYCKSSQDTVGETHALRNIGKIFEERKKFAQAREYFFQARELCLSIEDKQGESITLMNLARLLLKQGKVEASMDFTESALQIAEKINHPILRGGLYAQIGEVLYVEHKDAQALPYLYEGLELVTQTGDVLTQITILKSLAEIYEHLHDADKALTFYKKYSQAALDLASQKERAAILERNNQYPDLLKSDPFNFEYIQILLQRFPELTPAELKICCFVKNNLTSKEIGKRLSLSERTIENHRAHIRTKLRVPAAKDLSLFLMHI